MGKNLIQQRRGRGTFTYRAPSFRYVTAVKHRTYDDIEKSNVIKGKVIDLVHCPGHSAPLAKIRYDNNEINYIFAPEKIKVGDAIESGAKAIINLGCTLPLKNITEGTSIYNIESIPGDGGKFCRVAGSFVKLVSFMDNYAVIKMPSKKQKKIHIDCRATVGIIAGSGRKDKPWVKAGKKHHAMRARGKLYPRTSAVAMNAVDHPYGCGRGRRHAKIKPASRHAPPGRKVGKVASRRTGRRQVK